MTNYSVLMSVYYKENPEYLKVSIESILNQTVSTDDFVIVKDGPLTNELDCILDYYKNRYPNQINIFSLSENVGLGKALSYGLDKCKNDIVGRMDSDDISYLDRFEKQIAVLNDDLTLAVVGSWIDESMDMKKIISKKIVPEFNDELVKYSKKRCPLNHVSVTFRKKTVLDSGGYIDCHYNEDYYLWIRMIQQGRKIHNIQESLLMVRVGKEMYDRRGGLKYFKSEYFIQKQMLTFGQINIFRFILNVIIRVTVQVIIPGKIRAFLYNNIFRKKVNK